MTAIELVIEPRKRPVGNSTVERLLPYHRRRMVGPFIFADHFGPESLLPGSGVDIDAHPHIGLSTVSYLFSGRMVHRDSTGAVATIEAGAVNWMTAGSGVCHTERSHPDDRDRTRDHHGLQTWVALPVDAEESDPTFEHCDAAEVPSDVVSDTTVRVAAGSGYGLESPVTGSSPMVLADLDLADGAVAIDRLHPERAVIVIDGSLTLGDRPLTTGTLAVLTDGTSPVLRGTGHAILLGGEPVGPRHIWWNFVHSDRERIEAAKADWTAQRFPKVPGDHDPWVPLPE